jgi:hypothetical protein
VALWLKRWRRASCVLSFPEEDKRIERIGKRRASH